MPADFKPTRGNYTELKPFRFWCQKILPLVYDDSLSYYELLCKVVDYLNKTMEDVDTINDDVTNMYTAFEELQTYVNNYFDSSDFQTMVNNKLDLFASNGTLTSLMQPYLQEKITEWLNTNITQETGYVIDKSLTVEDAAGDAKAIGDRFKQDEKTIGTIREGVENHLYHFAPQISTNLIDLIDENGNVVTSIDWQGNIIARDFDSSHIIKRGTLYTPVPYDFAIADENNNVCFAIVKERAITTQALSGKKVSILGDSISTYDGYMPDGYTSFYPSGDLNNVEKTWWKQLCNELNLTLLKNASWSGSYVTGNSTGSAVCGCSNARINDLKDGDIYPDIILCYISTNDWATNRLIGSFTDEDEIPVDGTITNIAPAYALMLYKLRTTYPMAQVFCITSLEGRRTNDTSYPILNDVGETIHEVNHAITEVAHIFGCHVIDLNTSGIHFWNLTQYTTDGTIHPNTRGANVIKETVKEKLLSVYHNI